MTKKAKFTLIIGGCGVGKTWLMKEVLKMRRFKPYKVGMVKFMRSGSLVIAGRYTGEMFDGSDRLSRMVSRDFVKFANVCQAKGYTVLMEGDRFMNKTSLAAFSPEVLRIKGDGAEGRAKRGSKQTERHIKAIATRVSNFQADREFTNSSEALDFLQKTIIHETA